SDGARLRAWADASPPLTDNFPRRISLDRPRDAHDLGAFVQLLGTRDAFDDFTSSAEIAQLWPRGTLGRVSQAAFERQARLNTILSLPILSVPQVQALLGEGRPDALLVKAL